MDLLPKNCVANNSVVEIRTMIVEMAAIVGSIKSLRALNMCLVKVALTPPGMKIEMMTEAGSD